MPDPHDPAIIIVFLERNLKYTLELCVEGHRVVVDTHNRARLPLGVSMLVQEVDQQPIREKPRLLLAA